MFLNTEDSFVFLKHQYKKTDNDLQTGHTLEWEARLANHSHPEEERSGEQARSGNPSTLGGLRG